MDGDLVARFTAAQEKSRSEPPSALSSDTKLSIYGLYKQAEVGPCKTDRPGFFDQVGRAKHDAWSQLGEMSKEEAMNKYIEVVNAAYSP
jgi:acyl-CoA-binding protein